MSYLTESLKIEILMMIGYGDRARTQCEVVRLFRETHPDLPPLNQVKSRHNIERWVMSGKYRVQSKRQAVVDDDTRLDLLLALEENPITPARQLARDSNLNHKTFIKILKYEKKRPYTIALDSYFHQRYNEGSQAIGLHLKKIMSRVVSATPEGLYFSYYLQNFTVLLLLKFLICKAPVGVAGRPLRLGQLRLAFVA
ncbi:hypothetical protein NQ318_001481 [Aromia moschata]|uniref:DUF4817 domain-containing protein n=1 Tax=Aromia moschata TaxID=1265417 RepID=A0AAV8X9W7_9CUCU|nr:hypothetical protein NQ318_001481 [Aromia moschata]